MACSWTLLREPDIPPTLERWEAAEEEREGTTGWAEGPGPRLCRRRRSPCWGRRWGLLVRMKYFLSADGKVNYPSQGGDAGDGGMAAVVAEGGDAGVASLVDDEEEELGGVME